MKRKKKMSHNPNTIKSQDSLNDGKRSSDVVISAVEKCERLQKQLDIAVKRLEFLKKKTSAPYDLPAFKPIYQMIEKTLKEIEELNK